jgi:tRNA-dihydrouridine synthase C
MRAQVTPPEAATALRPLPFTGPWLLAPMEGITDPVFRDLVLERHRPEDLGGAFTEFVRVIDSALAERVLRRHLGPRRFATPVGLQLMGSNLDALASSAAAAVSAGAPLIDLNFGCPARGALKACAGSALLRDPAALGDVVRTVFEAVGSEVPVTAKIRAGFDDDTLLEELATTAESAGAALLTVHCRTRKDGYRQDVDWDRIARAVDAVSIPVCGNGGVRKHADLDGMRKRTGCAYVMVGHGALADPWIFSGRAVSAAEAARFLLDYEEGLRLRKKATPRGAVSRVKQLLRDWTAGGLVANEADRRSWLQAKEIEDVLGRLRATHGLSQ